MVTIKDVAKKSRTSIRTVSLILNNKHRENRISEDTVERVLRIARKLNYRPSASAISMRTGCFNTVSMILGATDDPGYSWYPVELLNSISDHLGKHRMNMLLARIADYQLTSEEYLPEVLREQHSDGFLVNYIVSMPREFFELVHRCRIPAVWLNTKLENDCVYSNDIDAGYRAADCLLAKGYRDIGYIGWKIDRVTPHYSMDERKCGYMSRMEKENLEPRVYLIEDPDFTLPTTPPLTWLKALGFPSAVIVYKEMDAIRLQCAAAEQGLKVPGDLAIFTFVNSLQSPHIRFPSIEIPFAEIGRIAVETLLEKIKNPGKLFPPAAVKGRTVSLDLLIPSNPRSR